MSAFDPKTFATMTFNEANSTESVPIPVGEWPFMISKVDIVEWKTKDGSKAGLKLVLNYETEDPAVTSVTGRPKNTVKHDVMLDLTDAGGLDFGKGMNVGLGRLREACGLNVPGRPFAFDQFLGHSIKVQVKHRPLDDGRLVADVGGVAKA
jgi:hypothetical protein